MCEFVGTPDKLIHRYKQNNMGYTNWTEKFLVDSHAEEFEKGFAVKPQLVSDKAYVHMYLHHDGYPEWRGIELANWIQHMQGERGFKNFGDGSRIASHLVHDFHYNSQYLYLSLIHISEPTRPY